MQIVPRDIAAYSALPKEEKAAAAIALAAGCSIGAYYAREADGSFHKKSRTIGIYEKPDEADPFPQARMGLDPYDRTQIPVYAFNGEGGKDIISFVAVSRGANLSEPEVPSDDKKRIAEYIAGMVALHLVPGNHSVRHSGNQQLSQQFAELARINEAILASHAKDGLIHPETLHAQAVSDLMRITLSKNSSDHRLADVIAAGYRIHDMAKLGTLPASYLMPEVNQSMPKESKEKRYFNDRNSKHPFDFMILFPFINSEIASNIALHHLSLSSDTKNKEGLPAKGVSEIAKYGRVADVFAALTDHARYPEIDGKPNPTPAVSAEAALEKIFTRAKASSDDIPLEQLGKMAAAKVFSEYAQSRHGMDRLNGGVEADISALKEKETEIANYCKDKEQGRDLRATTSGRGRI